MDDLAARLRAGIAAGASDGAESVVPERFVQPAAIPVGRRRLPGQDEERQRRSADPHVDEIVDRLFARAGLKAAPRSAGWIRLVMAATTRELDAHDELVIGRHPDPPGLQLARNDVSKNHLRISHDGECWTVTDLDSTNGSTIERAGARYRLPGRQPVVLAEGDVLEIPSGNAHSRIELG